MAWSVVQSKRGQLSASTAAVSVSFDSLPTVGNLVVCCVGMYRSDAGSFTYSDNQSGNTWAEARAQNNNTDSIRATIAYALVVGSSGTFTVTVDASTGTDSYKTVALVELSGNASSSVLGNVGGGSGNSGTASTGAVSTTVDGEIVIACMTHAGSNRTITEGGGFTLILEHEDGTTDMPISATYQTGATGSYTATWTFTSTGWVAAAACFKPAATTGQPTIMRSQFQPHVNPRIFGALGRY